MLRLRVWSNDETEQFDIELYDSAPVNLNYQWSDIQNINSAVGDYSQTFRVPATKRNLDFFGGVTQPTVQEDGNGLIEGRYNLKKKIRASLSYNTVPLINGNVQVKSIVRQKKLFHDIELVFFGTTVQLAASIGQGLLNELPLSSLNHELNAANIQASWLGGSASPFDGTIRYGIMDRGRNWTGATEGGVWSTTNPLSQIEMTPYLKAKYVFDSIVSQAGFTYDSTFLNSAAFTDLYVPLYNGQPQVVSDDVTDNTMHVGLPANETRNTGGWTTLDLSELATGAFDNGNNWTNGTDRWTSPAACFVFYNVQAYVLDAEVALYKNGSFLEYVTEVGISTGGSFLGYAHGTQNYIGLFMEAGDYLELRARKWTLSPTPGIVYGDNTVDGGGATNFEIWYVTDPVSQIDIDVPANMPPEAKQIDFVTSLQKMFNLVFVPDKLRPNHLRIEPMQDYLALGTAKNWTSKIDFTKDVVLKPTTDIQSAKYRWTHAKGQDFLNDAVQQSQDRVFGQYIVLDPDNDFARGENKVETTFAPYTMSLVPNTGFPIHRSIRNDGSAVQKPKVGLAYWCGLDTSIGNWSIRNDAGAAITISSFPVFSAYSDTKPAVESLSTHFGWEIPFIPSEAHPVNTLYYKYWAGYVNELYSSDARIIECFLQLTAEDISTFQFNDKIYLEGAYYRPLKILSFDATQEGVCKVILLKVLADIRDCVDLPTSSNTQGVVRFNNSATDYGSKQCCERYGYTWNPDKAGGNARCVAAGYAVVPTVD